MAQSKDIKEKGIKELKVEAADLLNKLEYDPKSGLTEKQFQDETERTKQTIKESEDIERIQLFIEELKKRVPQEDEPKSKKKEVTVQSEQVQSMMDAFKEKYKDDPWLEKNPPKMGKNGQLSMTFKSPEDMTAFFQKQAEDKNNSFIIVDAKTQQVMGFSKDGQLFHGDGKQFKEGDKLTPSGKKLGEFMQSDVMKNATAKKTADGPPHVEATKTAKESPLPLDTVAAEKNAAELKELREEVIDLHGKAARFNPDLDGGETAKDLERMGEKFDREHIDKATTKEQVLDLKEKYEVRIAQQEAMDLLKQVEYDPDKDDKSEAEFNAEREEGMNKISASTDKKELIEWKEELKERVDGQKKKEEMELEAPGETTTTPSIDGLDVIAKGPDKKEGPSVDEENQTPQNR